MRIYCLGFGPQNEELPCNETTGHTVSMDLICFWFQHLCSLYLFLSFAGLAISMDVVHLYVLRLKIPTFSHFIVLYKDRQASDISFIQTLTYDMWLYRHVCKTADIFSVATCINRMEAGP